VLEPVSVVLVGHDQQLAGVLGRHNAASVAQFVLTQILEIVPNKLLIKKLFKKSD
jgi:hypothetical protein